MRRKEVAKMLHLTGQTISRYYLDGTLTGKRLSSGQIDYDYSSVLNYLWRKRPYQVAWYAGSLDKDIFLRTKLQYQQKLDKDKLSLDVVLHTLSSVDNERFDIFAQMISLIEQNQISHLILTDIDYLISSTMFKVINMMCQYHHVRLLYWSLNSN